MLREAFDYPYHQIAEIVQTSEVTARQYVSRARKHLATERRAPVDASEQRRLLTAFIAAAQAGDLSALEQLFADGYWPGLDVTPVLVNGQHGVLLQRADTAIGVVTITASAEGIDQVLWMVNPAKLTAAL